MYEDKIIVCDECGAKFPENERNIKFHKNKHIFEKNNIPKFKVGDVVKYYMGLCQIVSVYVGLKYCDGEMELSNFRFLYYTDKEDSDGSDITACDMNELFKTKEQLDKEKSDLIKKFLNYNVTNDFDYEIQLDRTKYVCQIILKDKNNG